MELGISFRLPSRGASPAAPTRAGAGDTARADTDGAARLSVSQERQRQYHEIAFKEAKQLPEGDYINLFSLKRPVSELHRATFAAVRSELMVDQKLMPPGQYLDKPKASGSRKFTTYLLMPPAAYLSARAMMDVAQRLEEDGHANILPLLTTTELIQAVHHRASRGVDSGNVIQTTIQDTARALLLQADELRSSDLHIETRGDAAEVQFRIHGRRQRMADISRATAEAIAHLLFNFESADGARKGSWNPKEVKDTSFDVWEDTVERTKRIMRVRFHSTPIHPEGNFQIVMRLLRPAARTGGARPLSDIGYTPDQLAQIEEMLVGGSGLVLMVGPTNSGKSSSLHSFIEHLFRTRGRHIKVTTIESPVENELLGACQISASKDNFQAYLEASLRQDPDIVMVGEIRENLAALTVKDLVLAGHKIPATLHAYSAPAAFARLMQLGVEKDLLTMPGFISGVVYQRLIPTVCPHCGHGFDAAMNAGLVSRALLDRLTSVCDLQEHRVRFVNDKGCAHCKFSGIVDRTPAAEVLIPDSTFLSHVKNDDFAAAREHWLRVLGKKVAYGLGVTAMSHAILKMREGLVDPRDVETELGVLRDEGSH
ncbi:Flp pilus assembly complex ATPase component TadA [Acidovorax sp. SUPP950]|uniref:GspE/PulE family protein n=1 Tax=Acidovorax sp. SUPP950 TaxID=511901 RepID=UPI0023CC3E3F|nr:ATPase, T2SS/T4P/T4SS family [Acidovorax sp. SUPP950]GKS73270.1 Flp pilus assembly complex ATPase component TadA [Acidovorax sp. SUPP950]